MFCLVRVCELVPEGLLCLCRLFAGNLDTMWVPTLTSPPKLLCNMVSLQQVSQCILSLASVFPLVSVFFFAAECLHHISNVASTDDAHYLSLLAEPAESKRKKK